MLCCHQDVEALLQQRTVYGVECLPVRCLQGLSIVGHVLCIETNALSLQHDEIGVDMLDPGLESLIQRACRDTACQVPHSVQLSICLIVVIVSVGPIIDVLFILVILVVLVGIVILSLLAVIVLVVIALVVVVIVVVTLVVFGIP